MCVCASLESKQIHHKIESDFSSNINYSLPHFNSAIDNEMTNTKHSHSSKKDIAKKNCFGIKI